MNDSSTAEIAESSQSSISENLVSLESQKCFDNYRKIATDAVKERLITRQESENNQSTITVSQAIAEMLEQLGVEYAFGVSGGAIAPMWHALEHSSIKVRHFRHEAGAAFAATEAHFVSDRPVVVFTTTAPGIANVITGIYAARWEGAKVILISPYTSAAQRGKGAFQETTINAMAHSGLYTSGALLHYATVLESTAQLDETAREISRGLAKPDGFVAHLSIPCDLQKNSVEKPLKIKKIVAPLPTAGETTVAHCANLLSEGSFAMWLGFGARKASAAIRELAERTGCAVMCSPRGKGIFPENHPQFIGVTGFAGHKSVIQYMEEQRPQYTLVLGTQLEEWTSFWNPRMIPAKGFIQVDINSSVLGKAYPEVETIGIQSEIGEFVRSLLKHFPQDQALTEKVKFPRPQTTPLDPVHTNLVRPQVLMDQIQKIIIEDNDAIVMAEGGNSMAWAINKLRFAQPSFRVSTGFASMGHFSTGVVGASAFQRKAVAIVGDGAMLMNNEINTATRFQIPAVWIVLNDGYYNMCKQGTFLQGLKGMDTEIPQADFVKIAHGMGAEGIRVTQESELPSALETAMASEKPFVIDVIIDAAQVAPIGDRVKSLIFQDKNQ
ncbi:MAG: thiamine pyrophosphate-binding protein [Cyanobacteria bacterium J06558_2]